MAYTCSCGIPGHGSSLLLQGGVVGVNRCVYPPCSLQAPSWSFLQLCLVMEQFPQRASHNQGSANFPDSIIFLIIFLSHCGGPHACDIKRITLRRGFLVPTFYQMRPRNQIQGFGLCSKNLDQESHLTGLIGTNAHLVGLHPHGSDQKIL